MISEEFRQKVVKSKQTQNEGARDQRDRVHAELGLSRHPLPRAFEEKVRDSQTMSDKEKKKTERERERETK